MSETIQSVPMEETIQGELTKNNVTEKVIAELRDKYLPLKINGLEDKAGYEAVSTARKRCKSVRVLAEKICKKGREEAVGKHSWICPKRWLRRPKVYDTDN